MSKNKTASKSERKPSNKNDELCRKQINEFKKQFRIEGLEINENNVIMYQDTSLGSVDFDGHFVIFRRPNDYFSSKLDLLEGGDRLLLHSLAQEREIIQARRTDHNLEMDDLDAKTSALEATILEMRQDEVRTLSFRETFNKMKDLTERCEPGFEFEIVAHVLPDGEEDAEGEELPLEDECECSAQGCAKTFGVPKG